MKRIGRRQILKVVCIGRKTTTSKDCLICPAKKILKRIHDKSSPNFTKYACDKKVCSNCVLKIQCTRGSYRSVKLNKYQKALNWASSLRKSYFYKKAQRLRKRIERLFGEGKEQMGLRRARMRGKEKLTEQCLMTAMAQNIKRIVKAKGTSKRRVEACANQFIRSILNPIEVIMKQFSRKLFQIMMRQTNLTSGI